ncbi:hypothetical protein NO219_00505, partial [Gluconacetobacter entanii]|nr:hypothetical protein [Gluconacetobacter entanii]
LGRTSSIRGSQIAHVSSVKVPVLSPSSIPTIWEEIQDLTGPSLRECILVPARPLTSSQRKIWKYFLLVSALILIQILVGSIMAHMYYDRSSFYGFDVNRYIPFSFMRDVHIQAPIVWIGLS